MAAIPLHREEIEYPTSDGQPMAETTLHRKVMTDLIAALELRYEDDPGMWAGGNLLLYYEKGNARASVAPDVLLAPVPKDDRPIYKLWEEGRPPCLVVEVTSSSTRDEDLNRKKHLYERLGVQEYFLFDPYGDYLSPRLQGHRLEGGRYTRIPLETDGSLLSRVSGLLFRPEGQNVRLTDARTGERLLRIEEEAAGRRVAEQQARLEAAARQAAEERANALEEEIARLRAELDSKIRGG
ncbi:MAG TPA: Uma2 family endonuclease [Thermoanaerobaculia bacterium]|nr:Uma2 family endonuclease [Thermoanaerobaculia bacterium]